MGSMSVGDGSKFSVKIGDGREEGSTVEVVLLTGGVVTLPEAIL